MQSILNGYTPTVSVETQARNIADRLRKVVDAQTAARIAGNAVATYGLTPEMVRNFDATVREYEQAHSFLIGQK